MSKKISVLVRVYNHEKYIESCLNSILEQQSDYEIEILVGNDSSSDSSKYIIDKIAKNNSSIIPFHHKENLGALKNYEFLYYKAKGDYICVCDADDYFLPNKIQIQASFLNLNPQYNIVWHAMELVYNNKVLIQSFSNNSYHHRDISIRDVLLYGTIACFSSRMFRRDKVKLLNFTLGKLDNIHDIESLQTGSGRVLIDNVLGGYRVGIGIASSGDKIHNILISNLKYLLLKFPEYNAEISAHSLLSTLVCAKKGYASWKGYLKLVLSNFSLRTIPLFITLLYNIKSLKLHGTTKVDK